MGCLRTRPLLACECFLRAGDCTAADCCRWLCCATTDGAKIEFCAFTSPNGTNPMEYHDQLGVNNSAQLPSTRFEYLQNDFECTMKITNVEESDEGEWTCSIGSWSQFKCTYMVICRYIFHPKYKRLIIYYM